jgi:hypothetical protein
MNFVEPIEGMAATRAGVRNAPKKKMAGTTDLFDITYSTSIIPSSRLRNRAKPVTASSRRCAEDAPRKLSIQ